ncbi:unnamed protein product [Protopolystoma xenopodis]|uniref:Uncharacterized protein n=1 Tax=Protopolystoma xenopodis TaxID=117903 RepID=A0A448XL09_9PLAT|nr:unnamed protein product [Protopolystoma xenopodis]
MSSEEYDILKANLALGQTSSTPVASSSSGGLVNLANPAALSSSCAEAVATSTGPFLTDLPDSSTDSSDSMILGGQAVGVLAPATSATGIVLAHNPRLRSELSAGQRQHACLPRSASDYGGDGLLGQELESRLEAQQHQQMAMVLGVSHPCPGSSGAGGGVCGPGYVGGTGTFMSGFGLGNYCTGDQVIGTAVPLEAGGSLGKTGGELSQGATDYGLNCEAEEGYQRILGG